jgi:hypothetical protein
MEKKFESKLTMIIVPSDYTEYDNHKLLNTIEYFCYTQLKHINPNYLPNIHIKIGTKDVDSIGALGVTSVLDENSICIALSEKNIKEDMGSRVHSNQSLLKLLFHVFLHEFYHLKVLINLYLNSENGKNLENIAKCRYIERQKECRRLERQGCNSDELYFNMNEEIECERFALENLTFFKDLYEYDFLYTPKKAFMVKVKKNRRNRKLDGIPLFD